MKPVGGAAAAAAQVPVLPGTSRSGSLPACARLALPRGRGRHGGRHGVVLAHGVVAGLGQGAAGLGRGAAGPQHGTAARRQSHEARLNYQR